LKSQQLQRQTVDKRDRTSPVAIDHVSSHSRPAQGLQISSDRTSEDRVRGTNPEVDAEPAEIIGKKTYLTKWQAELQRRQETPIGQQTSHSEQKPQPVQLTSPGLSARKIIAPYSPPSSAATKHTLSSKFSKSVNDLSQITKPAAAATGKVRGRSGEQMTDWQLEAERRRAARRDRYIDPEILRRIQRNNTASTITETTQNAHKSMSEMNEDLTSGSTDYEKEDFNNPYVPALYKSNKKGSLSVSVDNLATCHLTIDTSRSNLQPGLTAPEPGEGRKETVSGASSETESSSWADEVWSPRPIIVTCVPLSSTPPDDYYESIDDFQTSTVAKLDNTCQVGDFYPTS